MLNFVTGECQGPLHHLVRHPPIATINIEIIGAILQEYADRFGLELANKRRVNLATSQSHVRPDGAENTRKCIRPLPGGGEGADGTTAGAADATVIPVPGESN